MASPAVLAHDVITTNLTFTQEVSRILNKHCVSCHRHGGTSMPLTTYEEARPWAKAIRDEVLERRMPPWDAVKGVGDFRDDQSLSQPEIDMLVGWVEGGAPEGDPVYLPPAPHIDPSEAPVAGREIELRQSITLARSMTIAGIRPHGALEVSACQPDGTVQHLIWVRSYHPQWKLAYYFRQPMILPKGARLMIYSHDGAAATLMLQ
jgi:hypothetical protein